MLKNLQAFVARIKAPTTEMRERAYLNDASDLYDLEYRERQIRQGLFRSAPYPRGGFPV